MIAESHAERPHTSYVSTKLSEQKITVAKCMYIPNTAMSLWVENLQE